VFAITNAYGIGANRNQYDPGESTRVHLLFDNRNPNSLVGRRLIGDFLLDNWGFEDTVRDYSYGGGSGTGEPNPNSPAGLAVVQVSSS
jgi:hypothetical protein